MNLVCLSYTHLAVKHPNISAIGRKNHTKIMHCRWIQLLTSICRFACSSCSEAPPKTHTGRQKSPSTSSCHLFPLLQSAYLFSISPNNNVIRPVISDLSFQLFNVNDGEKTVIGWCCDTNSAPRLEYVIICHRPFLSLLLSFLSSFHCSVKSEPLKSCTMYISIQTVRRFSFYLSEENELEIFGSLHMIAMIVDPQTEPKMTRRKRKRGKNVFVM